MSHLELVSLLVREYDPAIRFSSTFRQFELVEDTPSLTNDPSPEAFVASDRVARQELRHSLVSKTTAGPIGWAFVASRRNPSKITIPPSRRARVTSRHSPGHPQS
jgi:hypothetical protein